MRSSYRAIKTKLVDQYSNDGDVKAIANEMYRDVTIIDEYRSSHLFYYHDRMKVAHMDNLHSFALN